MVIIDSSTGGNTNSCNHCGGSGKCGCASCGKTITIEKEGSKYGVILKEEKQVQGICKVCKGSGRR